MKKVYEYKLHRVQGNLIHPDWVEDPGYFWNGLTYIGVIPDDQSRIYYIPDTLVEISKSDLINRLVLRQSDESNTERLTDAAGTLLTEPEIAEYVNQWWLDKVGE